MRTTTSQKETNIKSVREICDEAANDLEAAVSKLAGSGLAVPKESRLFAAIDQLRLVATTSEYPVDPLLRRKTVNAVNLAHDFSDIAAFLPQKELELAAVSLKSALRGSLAQDEQSRQPYQAQSELWMRSVLVRGALSLVTLDHVQRRSQPDYCIEIGTKQYAVEVKRPEKRDTVLTNLDKARDQIQSFNRQGIVVLDLSDVFGTQTSANLHALHGEIERELASRVWLGNDKGYRPGYSNILLIATAARGVDLKNRDGLSLLSIVNFSGTILFSRYAGTLHAIHAEHLKKGVSQGFAGVGFSQAERQSGWGRVLQDIPDAEQ